MESYSKSYAERLFSFPHIGPLKPEDAGRALTDPGEDEGVRFDTDAVAAIIELTKGYPYFLQEWGYQAWNHAESSPITLQVVQDATAADASTIGSKLLSCPLRPADTQR